MKIVYAVLLSALVFTNCKNNPPSQQQEEEVPSISVDTISKVNGNDLLEADEKPKALAKEREENHIKIVKKYGEQWDFCSCVTVHDSINIASQKEIPEKQLEKLMKRWEYIETKCKEFITNPNKTPEERELHEKKVQRCLSEKRSKQES